MNTPKSIRSFIGSHDFQLSRQFYRDLGWHETVIAADMVLIVIHDVLSFYLQDYYVKGWIENSMLLLEVEDLAAYYSQLLSLRLPNRYPSVTISDIKTEAWGREVFMHDPAGVLWHFAEFN